MATIELFLHHPFLYRSRFSGQILTSFRRHSAGLRQSDFFFHWSTHLRMGDWRRRFSLDLMLIWYCLVMLWAVAYAIVFSWLRRSSCLLLDSNIQANIFLYFLQHLKLESQTERSIARSHLRLILWSLAIIACRRLFEIEKWSRVPKARLSTIILSLQVTQHLTAPATHNQDHSWGSCVWSSRSNHYRVL